jgi:hypothetical protein
VPGYSVFFGKFSAANEFCFRTLKRQRPKCPDGTHHFGHDAYEPVSFARGDVVKIASFLLDAELFQLAQQHAVTLDCPVIALFVVAVAGMASQDHHTVGALAESFQNELRIDAAAAHHSYDA